ncbi:MAG: metallophosphoesterase family protein [Paracoccaceae bacterium]
MSEPIYSIGDIHGQLSKLHEVLDLIETDGGPDAKIVFLGDYTDRGPDSRGVLDLLIEGQTAKRPWIFLQGNHDRMFSMFLETPPQADPYMMVELYWLHPRLGGDTTLASYGVDASGRRRVKDVHADTLAAVPQTHIDFLKDLTLHHTTDDLMFVHAGIRPGVAITDQDEEDLIWIRQEFHEYHKAHPKLIVHGHTPIDVPTHYGNRVNLDTGAGYGKALTAAVFEAGSCYALSDTGRALLVPQVC